MGKQLIITIFIFSTILYGNNSINEEFNYIVNYFMMPSLEMKMKIVYPYNFENQKLYKIDVHTKTKSIFNKIFAIDNHYRTIYDPNNYTSLYFEKSIKQPNVNQELEIKYQNQKAQYSNGQFRKTPTEIYDFFSLLMYLRTINTDSLEQISITVDMEGELFESTFLIEKQEYLKVGKIKILTDKIKIIYKKLDQTQQSVLDYTDIFFWKIASEAGNKYIWIEQKEKRRIVKAKFSENKSWLEAKLIEEK